MRSPIHIKIYRLMIVVLIVFFNTLFGQDTLDHIIIRDAPDGGGSEFDDYTMTTDQSVTLYAAGYDMNNNYLGDISVEWLSTGSLDDININATSFTFEPVKAPAQGYIIARTGSISDITGKITVNLGALCYIKITPEFDSLTVVVVGIPNFYVSGYDCDGNYRSAVTATWSYIDGLDFNQPSCGRIVVTYIGFSDTSGIICVIENTISYIQIRSAANGGGEEFFDYTMTADDSMTLYCAAYDSLDHYVADINADWVSTGSLDDTNTTGANFTFNPIKAPTSGTIIATMGGLSDATGTITVNISALHHIRINASAGENGQEIGHVTLCARQSITLYAAGYDSDNNYRGSIEAQWSSTDTLDLISHIGTSYIFSPTTGNTSGTIIASYNGFSDTTGIISVCDDGILHYLKIRTAPGGAGQEFGDFTMTTDQSVTLYAGGYDAGDNYISDVNVSWSSTGTLDPVSSTGTSYTFEPVKAPAQGCIIAHTGSISDITGTITVNMGILHHIHIYHGVYSDTTIYLGTALTFYAAGYDASDNYLGDGSVDWGDIDVELTGTLKINFSYTGTASSYTAAPTDTGRGRIIFNKTDTTAFITVIENPLSLENQQFLPTQFTLETNAPNPFNNTTKIFFLLPKTTQTTLTIYDIAGRKVKELVNNRTYTPGRHSVVWDGTDKNGRVVGTGIYLCEIKTALGRAVRKMLLIK